VQGTHDVYLGPELICALTRPTRAMENSVVENTMLAGETEVIKRLRVRDATVWLYVFLAGMICKVIMLPIIRPRRWGHMRATGSLLAVSSKIRPRGQGKKFAPRWSGRTGQ
jgi:hypothetical protein